MMDELRVFISWSGEYARSVALIFREWLPNLSDRISPWASDADIDAGARSMEEIAQQLDGTQFGIILVTRENKDSPWLNFEAGALSRQLQTERIRVAPLLLDMSTPTELTGPLSQFQANLFGEDGVLRVVEAIAAVTRVEQSIVRSRYAKYWPDLRAAVEGVRGKVLKDNIAPPARSPMDLADETLQIVRSIGATINAMALSVSDTTLAVERRRSPAISSTSLASMLRETFGLTMFWIEDDRVIIEDEPRFAEESLRARLSAFIQAVDPDKRVQFLDSQSFKTYNADRVRRLS